MHLSLEMHLTSQGLKARGALQAHKHFARIAPATTVSGLFRLQKVLGLGRNWVLFRVQE